MGNVMGGPAAPPPPHMPEPVLEEDVQALERINAFFARQGSRSPLACAVQRRGTAAGVAVALSGAGGGGVVTDAAGFTALHAACVTGWDELLDKLLEGGHYDLNAASRDGAYTPLHLAALAGNRHACEALLERGADLTRPSRRGATAIHFGALSAAAQPALQALLVHPACSPGLVKQPGFRQRSALMLALVCHGHADVVRRLLLAGADPCEAVPSQNGVTPLHTCAHLSRVGALRALVEAGANVDARSADGVTVVQELFMQPPNRQRSEAAKRAMLRVLAEAGADLNVLVPGPQHTVLHFATSTCRDEETANLLLDSGVDASIAVNSPLMGQAGWPEARCSLLHMAAQKGWSRLVAALVAAGADMAARDSDGFLPLHAAVLACQADTVGVLLDAGADPHAPAPDCYPRLSKWRARRSIQAMQAALQEQGMPQDLITPLVGAMGAAMGGDAPHEGATLPAVDLACCVARHIPTVEAFVRRGVRPSEAALRLAEHAVPIMRAVVERPLVDPQLYRRLPARFRHAARELLLCLSRPVRADGGRRLVSLTPDTVDAILQSAAFPVSEWADAGWLRAQTVRSPAWRPAAPHAQQAGAAVGGGEAALEQAIMQAVQAQLPPGVVAGQPQVFALPMGIGQLPGHGLMGGLPGVPPGGGGMPAAPAGAAGGAAAAGAGAAAAGPGAAAGGGPAAAGGVPGVHMVQHQQLQQGNQNVHIMQFAVDLPPGMVLPPGMGMGGGPAGPPPAMIQEAAQAAVQAAVQIAQHAVMQHLGGGGGAGPMPPLFDLLGGMMDDEGEGLPFPLFMLDGGDEDEDFDEDGDEVEFMLEAEEAPEPPAAAAAPPPPPQQAQQPVAAPAPPAAAAPAQQAQQPVAAQRSRSRAAAALANDEQPGAPSGAGRKRPASGAASGAAGASGSGSGRYNLRSKRARKDE